MKKIISCVLMLSLCSITILSPLLECYAFSVPTTASFSYYVTHDWLNNSGGHTIVYNYGKNATIGSGSTKYLILAFGRQRQDSNSSDGWGVKTTYPDSYNETDDWVKQVVNEFRDGYDASGKNTTLYIVVGTSNDEEDWTQNGDSRFATAGTKWGSLVDSIANGTYSYTCGGNDFEGWNHTGFAGTYGSDATNWLDAYDAANDNSGLHYNYGSECYNEVGSTHWTQEQVYYVSYGEPIALVLPQVYNTTAQPQQWTTLTSYMNNTYGQSIYYYGVIGDSSWSTGWTNFNNDLVNAGFSDHLLSSASWGL